MHGIPRALGRRDYLSVGRVSGLVSACACMEFLVLWAVGIIYQWLGQCLRMHGIPRALGRRDYLSVGRVSGLVSACACMEFLVLWVVGIIYQWGGK